MELNGEKKKITSSRTSAVPVIEYSFGLVDWTKEDITYLEKKNIY